MSGVYFTAVGKNVCKPYSVHGQTVIVVPEYDAVANCSMEEKARLAAAAGAKLLLVESKVEFRFIFQSHLPLLH